MPVQVRLDKRFPKRKTILFFFLFKKNACNFIKCNAQWNEQRQPLSYWVEYYYVHKGSSCMRRYRPCDVSRNNLQTSRFDRRIQVDT